MENNMMNETTMKDGFAPESVTVDEVSSTENVETLDDIVGIVKEDDSSEVIDVDVDSTEEKPNVAIDDPDNPLNEHSIAQIGNLLKQVHEMVQIMEEHWTYSKNEFKLTDDHMKKLYQYNETHRTEMPEDISEEEQENWDRFNGLNNIPEEVALEIFGEGHPIIGIEHTITIDRIKDCVNDFFAWMSAMKEYRQIHDAYLKLIEIEEQKNIEMLKAVAEKETDPEKKAKMEESIALYYNRKYLEFMSEEMNDEAKNRLVKTFSDSNKIEYLLNRTRDKLSQIKVAEKFILEISQFEKRYLEEKYHKASNILLLYFMNLIVYHNMSDSKSIERNKVLCMVFALDGIIRKTFDEENTNKILDNIRAMEDQIIDMLPEATEEE